MSGHATGFLTRQRWRKPVFWSLNTLFTLIKTLKHIN